MNSASLHRAGFTVAILASAGLAGQAQAPGPTAPATIWKKVLDRVQRDGKKGTDSGFFTRALTGSTGDPKLDYTVHSIIVFYFVDSNQNFKVVGAELSTERSTLETGTIRTDFWTMLVKPSGRVDQVTYKQRVDVPGDELIPGTSVLVDLTDPRVQARFSEMLRFWSTP